MADSHTPLLPDAIQKEITRHPPSLRPLPPQVGDEVEVHYVARLKNSSEHFDSSRERGEVFKYKVGQGEVIDGWERGVQTMRKGEHARFTIAPRFAYGEDGDGEHVPPNSTVVLEIELVNCPAREDLFDDMGAVKRELKDGPGGRHPRTGDECQITYKVTVEGCGVAMAAQHAVYKVGSEQMGQIARVVDKALAAMKRSDEVLITCQPSYAFGAGDGQYAGKVATIFLGLEEIYEVHDMSLGMCDKTVLRKRIKEGDGSDRLHDTARVTVRVKSVTAGQERAVSSSQDISFTAGRGEVCDALEGSVRDMKEGEEALLRCESAEAVVGGLIDIPSGLETPIMIHIAVLSFEKVKEKWDLSGPERIERGRARKEVATDMFKRGRVRLAAHLYELVADLCACLDFFHAEIRKDAAELRRTAKSNRAMCMLKLGDMGAARSLCTDVLAEDPTNPKALFRRAKAMIQLKEFTEAITDLERLLGLEPSNQEGKQLLREAKRLRSRSDAQAANTFAKMCAGLGNMPERADRQDDDVVVMPDLNQEYAKIAREHNLPLPAQAPAARPPQDPPRGADTTAAGPAAACEQPRAGAGEGPCPAAIEQPAPETEMLAASTTA